MLDFPCLWSCFVQIWKCTEKKRPPVKHRSSQEVLLKLCTSQCTSVCFSSRAEIVACHENIFRSQLAQEQWNAISYPAYRDATSKGAAPASSVRRGSNKGVGQRQWRALAGVTPSYSHKRSADVVVYAENSGVACLCKCRRSSQHYVKDVQKNWSSSLLTDWEARWWRSAATPCISFSHSFINPVFTLPEKVPVVWKLTLNFARLKMPVVSMGPLRRF